MQTCGICGRVLNVEADPLSGDCGGDCWGCIGLIEAKHGWQQSVDFVAAEIASGLRDADGKPKPPEQPLPKS
ncbi:hypothetical protein SAMN05421819_2218 [Bryocella elongata]|uniref:Uncharacterized protein n=1 Tax=Bryocella elongata TaxID=863522 RepID=A0A1H5YBR4_9BACT|nr:hypothetical protein SAMN05421819_2218 [Bryocella elongata]